MADESKFKIKVESTSDDAALSKTGQELAKLGQEAASTGQKLNIGLAPDAFKVTAKAAEEAGKKIEEGGEAAHEAGVSHHELHQAFHLLKEGAGEALGPIGEFAHFLGNPYIMAVAGATLAIKTLIEQHEEERENVEKNITSYQHMKDALRDAIVAGAEKAREKMDELAQAHDRAALSIDAAAAALRRSIELQKQHTESIISTRSAVESLREAQIHLAEEQGRITGTDAQDLIESNRRKAETAKRSAEIAEQQEENNLKKDRAAKAREAADIARNQMPAEEDLAAAGAAEEHAKTTLEDRRKALDQAKETAAKAQAGIHGGGSSAAIAASMKEVEQQVNEAAKEYKADYGKEADRDQLRGYYGRRKFGNNFDEYEAAQKAMKAAQDDVDTAEKSFSESQRKNKALNRQADVASETAEKQEEIARQLDEEISLNDELLAKKRKQIADETAIGEQTDAVNRQIRHEELRKKVQAGGGTSLERQEVANWDSQDRWSHTGRGQIGISLADLTSQIQTARRTHQMLDPQQANEFRNEILGLLRDHA